MAYDTLSHLMEGKTVGNFCSVAAAVAVYAVLFLRCNKLPCVEQIYPRWSWCHSASRKEVLKPKRLFIISYKKTEKLWQTYGSKLKPNSRNTFCVIFSCCKYAEHKFNVLWRKRMPLFFICLPFLTALNID